MSMELWCSISMWNRLFFKEMGIALATRSTPTTLQIFRSISELSVSYLPSFFPSHSEFTCSYKQFVIRRSQKIALRTMKIPSQVLSKDAISFRGTNPTHARSSDFLCTPRGMGHAAMTRVAAVRGSRCTKKYTKEQETLSA